MSGADDAKATKDKADALGVLVRAGVEPDEAARRVGLEGIPFRPGLAPITLKPEG